MKLFCIIFFFGLMSSLAQALPPGAEKWPAECDAGNAKACYFHGMRVLNGDKIKKDRKTAAAFGFKACNLGIPDACFMVGKLFYYGADDFPLDKKESFKFMDVACKQNLHKKLACYYAADALLTTGGDVKTALALANKGCLNKEANACTIITEGFMRGKYGLPKSAAKTYEYAMKGCDLNDKWSCYTAGMQISSGNELGDDYAKAASLFAKSCDGGMKQACYSAGKLNLMAKKPQEALPYLIKSCKAGDNIYVCRDAGNATADLQGPSPSRPWYQKGCEAGDQPSCDYIKELNRYEKQNAAYAAQQAKKKAATDQINAALNSGNYTKAMEIATYGFGSRAEAARVVLTAERNGKISSIDPFYFSFLQQWLAMGHPQANAIVRREFLKNPEGQTSTQYSNRGTPAASATKDPSLSDQFWKNEKARYKRELDRANRGGKPAGFESKVR